MSRGHCARQPLGKFMTDHKVPLYKGERCIGQVTYTENLDRWDGRNYQSGGTGRHLGIGKTKNGNFYIVHGTNWQGEHDVARVITEDEAKQHVMSIGHNGLYKLLFGEEIPTLD
jgi:hypothetical protein